MADVIKFQIGSTAKVKISAKNASRVYIDVSGYTSLKVKIAKSTGLDDDSDDTLFFETILPANFSHGSSGWHNWTAAPSVTKEWTAGDYFFEAEFQDGSGVITGSIPLVQCSIVVKLIDVPA